MATHSIILAWKIPWTEEPGGLQSTGLCQTLPHSPKQGPLVPESHASAPQLENLRETLFSTEEEPSEPLVQNYRAPQPLNQRMVFASFIQGDCTGLGKRDRKLGDSMAGTRMPLRRKRRLQGEGIPRPCLDWDPPCPKVPSPQGWHRAASSWVGIWSR